MKKIENKIWWLILIYLVLGYIFPVMLRQRFMIVILAITGIMTTSILSLREKVRLISLGIILSAFFLKIIPSPYTIFLSIDLPMAVGLVLTIFIVFLSCILVAGITDIIFLRVKRTEE